MNKLSLLFAVAAGTALVSSAQARDGSGGLTANAVEAAASLETGLKDGMSLEASSIAGYKAEQALLGLAARGPAPVRAAASPSAGTRDSGIAARPADRRRESAEVPAPPAPGREAGRPNLIARMKNAATGLYSKAEASMSGWGRAKKIAVLTGLLAVEAAAMLYPVTALTVVVMGLGVLGIFGTTRELINTIRRGKGQ